MAPTRRRPRAGCGAAAPPRGAPRTPAARPLSDFQASLSPDRIPPANCWCGVRLRAPFRDTLPAPPFRRVDSAVLLCVELRASFRVIALRALRSAGTASVCGPVWLYRERVRPGGLEFGLR